MIGVVWVRWHRLDHPVAELWQQLEVGFLHLVCQLLEGLTLLHRLVFIFVQLGLSRELCDYLISIAAQQHPLILLVELVKFVFDLFAPVQIFGLDLLVFVHVV